MSTNGNGDAPVKRKRGRPPGPVAQPYRKRYRSKVEGIKSVARDGLDLMLHEVRQVRAYTDDQQTARNGLEVRAKAGEGAAMGELWRRAGWFWGRSAWQRASPGRRDRSWDECTGAAVLLSVKNALLPRGGMCR